MEGRSGRFTAIGDQFADYTVYDQSDQKLGKLDELFLDESDQPEYIGVKTGLLGTRSTLIPFQMATVEDSRQAIVVATDKDTAKNGPSFDDEREITPEFENEVYSYYGLQRTADTGSYRSYGSYDPPEATETTGVAGRTNVGGGEELRVQRSEEELVAGTRKVQSGAMRVRKRVRVDREQIEVPTRHEEVSVERVPVSGEVSEAGIGEDEVVVPVTEEEIVVEKRPVVKEEVRIKKDVVEDTEVVEEDVRREEIDIEDQTDRHAR
jgi:uncharacterized protein (TIGR02271 family)